MVNVELELDSVAFLALLDVALPSTVAPLPVVAEAADFVDVLVFGRVHCVPPHHVIFHEPDGLAAVHCPHRREGMHSDGAFAKDKLGFGINYGIISVGMAVAGPPASIFQVLDANVFRHDNGNTRDHFRVAR